MVVGGGKVEGRNVRGRDRDRVGLSISIQCCSVGKVTLVGRQAGRQPVLSVCGRTATAETVDAGAGSSTRCCSSGLR